MNKKYCGWRIAKIAECEFSPKSKVRNPKSTVLQNCKINIPLFPEYDEAQNHFR